MVDAQTVANVKGVLTILMWSFSALFILWTPEIPPFLLASFTSPFGCTLFGFRWIRNRERLWRALKQPLPVWCLFFVAVVVYRGCYLSGLKIAPTVEANLINYLWPSLIVIFGAIVDRSLPKPLLLFGAAMGFLGVSLLLFPSIFSGKEINGQIGVGHFLALFGAISWSGYSVMTRRIKVNSSDLLGVMHGLAALTFVTLHLIFENPVV
jgi:drug/metabolite transporter (DMT)-like permease